jgi:hypothetical protein
MAARSASAHVAAWGGFVTALVQFTEMVEFTVCDEAAFTSLDCHGTPMERVEPM